MELKNDVKEADSLHVSKTETSEFLFLNDRFEKIQNGKSLFLLFLAVFFQINFQIFFLLTAEKLTHFIFWFKKNPSLPSFREGLVLGDRNFDRPLASHTIITIYLTSLGVAVGPGRENEHREPQRFVDLSPASRQKKSISSVKQVQDSNCKDCAVNIVGKTQALLHKWW